MFASPRYVIKDGQVVIDDHEIRRNHEGRLLHVAPEYDSDIEQSIKPFFKDFYSIEFSNYAVADSYLHRHEVVPSGPQREPSKTA